MTVDTYNKWMVPNLGAAEATHGTTKSIEEQKKIGFEQGYQDGLAKAMQSIDQKIQGIDALATELKSTQDVLEPQVMDVLESYCQVVIKSVLHQELKVSDTALHNLIAEGLEQLSSQSRVTVEIHPELLNSHRESLGEVLKEKGILLCANPNLQMSEVRIKDKHLTMKSDLNSLIDQVLLSDDKTGDRHDS